MCDLDSDIVWKQQGHPTNRTRDPYVDKNPQKRCLLTPKHVEEDQTGTGRPVLVDQKEEHEIDFSVP